MIALGVFIFEVYRFAAKSGPHTGGNRYHFIGIWSVVSLLGSLVATIGTIALSKGMLLTSALIFCCAVAPATPNMIVLSAGEEYQYWNNYLSIAMIWIDTISTFLDRSPNFQLLEVPLL